MVIDVTESNYLARDIMLIQPTQYRASDLVPLDHQTYLAVGQGLSGTHFVTYSVNQAGQLKLMDQFTDSSGLQAKQLTKEKVMFLDPDNSAVRLLDVEKERVSKVVFDQIISERLKTLRPLREDCLVLTTVANSIFLVNF